MKTRKIKEVINNPLLFTDAEKDEILKRFMKEFFHFPTLCKAGFFKKEMKGDYKAQAERVRSFFGFKSVYEYGLNAILIDNGFTGTTKSIFE